MHRRILLKNAILVNEGRQFLGALLIDNDRIEQILEGRDAQPTIPPQETVDLDGAYILPGVIDEHVHFRDPGLTAKADFHTESLAAAAGGGDYDPRYAQYATYHNDAGGARTKASDRSIEMPR